MKDTQLFLHTSHNSLPASRYSVFLQGSWRRDGDGGLCPAGDASGGLQQQELLRGDGPEPAGKLRSPAWAWTRLSEQSTGADWTFLISDVIRPWKSRAS